MHKVNICGCLGCARQTHLRFVYIFKKSVFVYFQLKIITEQHNALKKNYASLLQTAKAELTRKSRMLAQSAGSSGSWFVAQFYC